MGFTVTSAQLYGPYLLPSSLGPVTVEFVTAGFKALAVLQFIVQTLCGASDIGRNTSCFNEMQPEFGLLPAPLLDL